MHHKMLHFVQHDLQVQYINDSRRYRYESIYTKVFYILILFDGTAKISYPDKIYIAKPGDMFIAGVNDEFTVETDDKSMAEYLEIRFLGKFYHELDNAYDLLEPFYQGHTFKITPNVLDDQHIHLAVDNIIRALVGRSGRAITLSSVLQLICEIYMNFEKDHVITRRSSETTFNKIVKYIDTHLYENITLASASSETFISERCITDTVRRICGVSFHRLITERRIDDAKRMLAQNYLSVSKIAESCGFETYSTFYREFKNITGMTPSQYRKQEFEKRKKGIYIDRTVEWKTHKYEYEQTKQD